MSLPIHVKDKRTYIKGLSLDCPFDCTLDTCPLNPLRDLPHPQLISTIDDLPEETIDYIITHHQSCLEKRLADGES